MMISYDFSGNSGWIYYEIFEEAWQPLDGPYAPLADLAKKYDVSALTATEVTALLEDLGYDVELV